MKKSVAKKIKQSCKGAMSIFLCVLVTPFVSIACGLVEVYRYQGAVQTYRDVVDATQFSSLANSDEYLKDRFGLFAMSQQEDDDVFKNFINDLNDNLSILGNAITTGDTKANGKNPLSEPNVLKTQIKDNAEINVPVNMLKDIVGSTGVMEKIENRFSKETKEKFEKVKKGVDAASAVAEVLDEVASFINEIKKSLEDLKTDEFEEKTNEFIKANNEFLTQLYNDKFDYHTDNNNSADSKLENILENNTYFSKVKNIYNSAKKLSDNDGVYAILKGKLENILKIIESFNEAKEKVEELHKKTSDEKVGFEDVIDNLYEKMEEAAEDFNKTEFEKYITLLDNFISNRNKISKLSKSDASSYSELTSSDKDNIKSFLSTLMGIYYDDWNDSSLSESERNEKLNNSIKKIYGLYSGLLGIGDFANSITNYIDAMNNLLKDFINNSSDNIDGFLDELVKMMESLFNMHTLFDGRLNAKLSQECVSNLLSSGDSPFQTLLEGIQELMDGIRTVKSSLTSDPSILDFFKGCKQIFNGAKAVIKSVSSQVSSKIAKVQEFIEQIKDPSKIYDELLIDGYIVYNLPNRTNAANGITTSAIKNQGRVNLDGESLTGYKYEDIITQSTPLSVSQEEYQTMLENMSNVAYGSDNMFKGAEAEYVLVGTSNEIFNQVQSFFDVFMLRLVSNIYPVMKDTTIKGIASTAGLFAFVVYIAFILLESYIDTILLVNGSDVPLIKETCYFSASGIPVLLNKIKDAAIENGDMKKAVEGEIKNLQESNEKLKNSKDNFKDGLIDMKYNAYLFFALKLGPTVDVKLGRLANIIQLEADSYYRNGDLEKIEDEIKIIQGGTTIPEEDKTVDKGSGSYFKINQAYTTINTTSKVTFNPFISILNISDNSIFTKQYSQDLSY